MEPANRVLRKNASWRIGLVRNCITSLLALSSILAASHLALAQHYEQTNLVSDLDNVAKIKDSNLVNAWGLARSGSSPWWVADNGTGVSTLYNGAGQPFPPATPLVVTIPPPPSASGPSAPTGVVFNDGTDFAGARFIFDTEDGTIASWSGGPVAVLQVNNSGSAIYKGLALGLNEGQKLLYAANFFAGTIDVFDKNFSSITFPVGAFTDPQIPAGFAPFNVQNINGMIFVAFAMQDEEKEDEIAGAGLGYVDAFDTSGKLIMRLKSGRWMNAPWGIALAPSDFGKFSGDLLVGNFGSGEIAAFDVKHGNFKGLLRGRHGQPITIDGLWALGFGNNANAGPANTLFFTAGIDDEAHGLFGTLTPISHGDHDDEEGDQ